MDNKDNTSLFEAYEQVLTSDIGPCAIHREAPLAVLPAIARGVARYGPRIYKGLRKTGVPKNIAKPLVRGPGAAGTGVAVGSQLGGADGAPGEAGQPGYPAAAANLDSDGDGIPDSQDADNTTGAASTSGDRDEEDVKIKTATYQLNLPEIYAQQIYDQLGSQLGAGKGIEREVDDEKEREAGEGDSKPSTTPGAPAQGATSALGKPSTGFPNSGNIGAVSAAAGRMRDRMHASTAPHAGAGATARNQ